MKITKQYLVTLCDNFLSNKIDKAVLRRLAANYIISNESDLETDQVLRDTLFEWEDEEMNFPINNINMALWKDRLLTGADNLIYYNDWNSHIHDQQIICSKYNTVYANRLYRHCCATR